MNDKNFAYVSGKIPERGIIEVTRYSGVKDRIPFVSVYGDIPVGKSTSLIGELRTRNVVGEDCKNHKETYLVVREKLIAEEANKNEIEFTGTLVKKAELRQTPLGRTIIEFVVAINCGIESYYPSVIAWGNTAEKMQYIPIGARMEIQGRFQSREYVKELPEGNEVRTAYEISVKSARVI